MPRVLGIDPGTHRIGWAVIEGSASKQSIVAHGCLNLAPGTPHDLYLPQIYELLNTLMSTHHPVVIGLESLLFQKNVKTALSVAEARGVIMLAAAQANIPVLELAPNTVKSAVAGHGGAAKTDVNRMVGLLLGVDTAKLLDDETDALAIALTTIITYKNHVPSTIN